MNELFVSSIGQNASPVGKRTTQIAIDQHRLNTIRDQGQKDHANRDR
jgi:hypothetical protein